MKFIQLRAPMSTKTIYVWVNIQHIRSLQERIETAYSDDPITEVRLSYGDGGFRHFYYMGPLAEILGMLHSEHSWSYPKYSAMSELVSEGAE